MDRWIQPLLAIEQSKDEIILPPQDREQVVDATARLLLQILNLAEERVDEDDLR